MAATALLFGFALRLAALAQGRLRTSTGEETRAQHIASLQAGGGDAKNGRGRAARVDPMAAPRTAAHHAPAESLIQTDIPRDQVISTIHTDQVFLVQRRQSAGVHLIADADEEVSRVLPLSLVRCALQVYAFGGGRVVRDGYPIPASK